MCWRVSARVSLCADVCLKTMMWTGIMQRCICLIRRMKLCSFAVWSDVCFDGICLTSTTTTSTEIQSGPDDGSGAGLEKPTRVRVEFPETWIWFDSTTGYPAGLALTSCLVVQWRLCIVFPCYTFCSHFFAYFLACCTSRLCSLNVFMGTFWTFLEPAYLCIACLFSLESSYTCLHHVRNAIYTSPIAMITRSFQYADDTQLFVALSPSNPLSDITNLTSFLHVRRDTAWHTSAIQMLCFSALCICRRLLRLVVWPHQNSWRHSRLPSFPRWTH